MSFNNVRCTWIMKDYDYFTAVRFNYLIHDLFHYFLRKRIIEIKNIIITVVRKLSRITVEYFYFI